MIEKLKKLGLTDGEAKVYSAMLKKGSSTVGPIVKESGVAYSNIYEVIERLTNKGLVTYILKEKTKHFQATQIENLKEYLDKKKKGLKEQEETLKKLIPEIKGLSGSPVEEAEIFVGKKGLKSAYKIMFQNIKKNEKFLFFYVRDIKNIKEADEFYLDFSINFKDSGVDLRGISTSDYRNNEAQKQTAAWTKMRYVNFPVPSNVDIFRDKVLFISWEKPIGFLITSKELSDNFREYFNSIWKQAKP